LAKTPDFENALELEKKIQPGKLKVFFQLTGLLIINSTLILSISDLLYGLGNGGIWSFG
jgi:hypothetical protein